MAMDSVYASHPRHFYLAVDRLQFKMQTVIELVARRPCFLIVVCCSTRNDLDSLCSPLPFVFCSALSQTHFLPPPNEDERSHMIIVTDACLPLLASGEFPLNAHLLINYELPAKKETYGRCLISRYCADGIVINMVVGGEVVTLKSIEESSTIVMQEMPMQILDFMKTILLLAFVNG
ncbi:hypothetical protein GLYMA_11G056400v4 [Glycine max]|uniref:Helicase C-terminal domain-containing protein n=1 Tax=Glycine max TaxID=3847 RepID=K7LN78_SOYBN|nr:hypothetical protein GLYMA_11G056400v4 [Glycine max]